MPLVSCQNRTVILLVRRFYTTLHRKINWVTLKDNLFGKRSPPVPTRGNKIPESTSSTVVKVWMNPLI